MIKKHQIGLFVNTGTEALPVYKRIKKSTELTISMEAETEDYDYIADESPTTELTEYKPEIEQPLKMIKDEDDFEFFWDMFYQMKTGEEAKVGVLIAFIFDSTEVSDTMHYRAWKVPATVIFKELKANDSELNFNLNFGGAVSRGYVTMSGGVPTWEDSLPTGG